MAQVFRWVASTVWTILIVPVIVLLWRGALDRGDFANHPVDWVMGWLASVAQIPGIYPSALIATGLLVGVWIDWLLKKFDGSRASRRESLGNKFCYLSYMVQKNLGSYDLEWPNNIHNLRPDLMSAFIEAESFGIWAPVGHFESIKGGGPILANYLHIVGTMLKDGHFKQAKLRALQAKEFAEQQAISETRP